MAPVRILGWARELGPKPGRVVVTSWDVEVDTVDIPPPPVIS